MSRHFLILCGILAWAIGGSAGCRPQQPFFFHEDGDLSHYVGRATDIEYPDVETATLDEVNCAIRPFSLENPDPSQIWELSLEEAVRIALDNSKVIRSLPLDGATADNLQRNPDGASTVYDPALREADPRFGVAAALSAFDAQFSASASWEKNDLPQNIAGSFTQFRPTILQQDLGSFQARLAKQAATGAVWSLTHNVSYEANNVPVYNGVSGSRLFASDWNVNVEAEFRQPLLQGNGVQFNRIAGPNSIPGWYRGVMIARLDTDISLTDFEGQVRNLINDVEVAYWSLYREYRTLHALTEGRDRSLETWRRVRSEYEGGIRSGAQNEAQARHQYFEFKGQVESAQSAVYTSEASLRYVLGLASTDGRLIRPLDEPTTAEVCFEWHDVSCEALVRSMHLRRQKWVIKKRELELIGAKNFILPRLDAIGRYRWRGMGDHLIDPSGPSGVFDNAYQTMTEGDFQEWLLGLELSIPLGFRKEMAGIRHAQLSLARERAVLEDLELETSHSLGQALRDLEKNYALAQTNFNKRLAALAELQAWKAIEASGMSSSRDKDIDRLLDAQRRMALAEIGYYQSLVDYNKAIAQVHFRKGSLLEYNGVCLAEGPWPAKAQFDATRRARARDASFYLDYGFTRPSVISQGPYQQHAGTTTGRMFDAEGALPHEASMEMIPTPAPERDEALPEAPELWGPEAASVLEQEGSEPAMLPANVLPPANDGAAVDPSKKKGNFDHGTLDLRMLAGKLAKPAKSRASRPASPIETVAYEETSSPSGAGQKQRGGVAWKTSTTSSTRRETVSQPSTAPPESSSLRWKPVKR